MQAHHPSLATTAPRAPTKQNANAKTNVVQTLKDALERAYAVDSAGGDVPRAAKLYAKGLEIVEEALQVEAPSSGLSARADSVALWREELGSWQANVLARYSVVCALDGDALCAVLMDAVFCVCVGADAAADAHSPNKKTQGCARSSRARRRPAAAAAPCGETRPL